MSDILTDLNPSQQAAVSFKDGPLLILAGAGSGKTRALTHRAAYLMMEKKVSFSEILLLTFTNKAAGEMKERIKALIVNRESLTGKSLPYAGTFHSFCARILRQDGRLLGIPENYVIYDEDDQEEAIKVILQKLNFSSRDYKPGSVLNTISQAKNELISALEYPQYARGPWQKNVAEIYLEYQSFLHRNFAVDFDDLIFETVNLFRKCPEVLGKYQNHYHYILVDEYQDTNTAQYVLTKILAQRYRNLTVVGDASQSIYGWRGANFRNLVNLKSDFSDLTVINLEQNYRSTQTILNVAYCVIKQNTSHPVLKLWTNNPEGEKVKLYEAESEIAEAEFVVNKIKQITRQTTDYGLQSTVDGGRTTEERTSDCLRSAVDSYTYKDFAVLYRTNLDKSSSISGS